MKISQKSQWLPLWMLSNMTYSLLSGMMGIWLPLALVSTYSHREIGVFQVMSTIGVLLGSLLAHRIIHIPFAGFVQVWENIADSLANVLIGIGAGSLWASITRLSSYTASSLSAPSFGSFIAEKFSDDDRGKIYAIQMGASSLLSPIGIIIGSSLLIWFDPTFLLVTGGILGCGFSLLPLIKKGTWNFSVTY